MHNQPESSAGSTLGASPFQHPFRKRLSLRRHRIDVANQYIKINKNRLQFSSLIPSIKYFFIQTYKKCATVNCLADVFKGWNDETITRGAPKTVIIKDSDALQLIYRMMKTCQKAKQSTRLNALSLLLQQKNEKLKYCLNLQQQTKGKIFIIQNILKQRKVQPNGSQKQLYLKLEGHLKQLALKVEEFKEKIKKIKNSIIIAHQQLTTDESAQKRIKQITNKTINKIARNLIKQTILFIVELQQNKPQPSSYNGVFVVFEQSYHTIKVRKQELIKILSSEGYLQKSRKFSSLGLKFNQTNESQSFLCCHRCMQTMSAQKLKVCKKRITKRQTSSYASTDGQMFKRLVLESDFFGSTEPHVLPYFVYNFDENGQRCCNRAFCNECLVNFYRANSEAFDCPYCSGYCNCQRCQIAVSLVRLMAYDSIDQSSYSERNYHNILKLLCKDPSKYVLEGLKLRKSHKLEEIQMMKPVLPAEKQVELTFNFNEKKQSKTAQASTIKESSIDRSDSKKEETCLFELEHDPMSYFREELVAQSKNWNLFFHDEGHQIGK